jgi:histidine triad (HIT) family protein
MPIELRQVDLCLFCERVGGRRDDWAVVQDDELTVCFVSPIQFEAGQVLVIPRRHAPTLLDLTAEEAKALMCTTQRAAKAMVAAFDPDGITVYQNNGVASRQEVPHVHVHVVPRRYGSGWGEGPPHIAALERGDRTAELVNRAAPIETQRELAAQIRACL